MKDKQKGIIADLETMKEAMVDKQHFDDARVISDALKYIRSFTADMDRHIHKNKELIATIKILADQADTKKDNLIKDNLINFHSANILQGMLIKGSTLGDEDIVYQAVELAKRIIAKLKEEALKGGD